MISRMLAVVGVVSVLSLFTRAADQPLSDQKPILVTFSGGYDLDARDMGRPVGLMAAALGVKPDTLRASFAKIKTTHTHPTIEEMRQDNKFILDALPGVSYAKLATVLQYYSPVKPGELWHHDAAMAFVTVKNGVVSDVTIIAPGDGYSSVPYATIPGFPKVHLKATLHMGTKLDENGSVVKLAIAS